MRAQFMKDSLLLLTTNHLGSFLQPSVQVSMG